MRLPGGRRPSVVRSWFGVLLGPGLMWVPVAEGQEDVLRVFPGDRFGLVPDGQFETHGFIVLRVPLRKGKGRTDRVIGPEDVPMAGAFTIRGRGQPLCDPG